MLVFERAYFLHVRDWQRTRTREPLVISQRAPCNKVYILRLIANGSMYGDGVWPCTGNFLELFSVGLNEHAPPSTPLFVQPGIAKVGAIKRAKLQEGAVVSYGNTVPLPGYPHRLGCRTCLVATRSSTVAFQS